jgi:hypothetical protein
MSEEYEYYDQTCPKCGHSPLHLADCTRIGCEDGYLDEFDDDPINFPAQGEEFYPCPECHGTGAVVWCPKCGTDLTGFKFPEDEQDDFVDPNQTKIPFP